MATRKKYMAGINKISKGINSLSGADDLVNYAGSKIAKARAPKSQKKYVKDTTSGKQALKSAARVGATIAGTVVGGGALKVAKAAKTAKAKKAARFKRRLNETSHAKRLRLYENEARRAAKRRLAKKRKKK